MRRALGFAGVGLLLGVALSVTIAPRLIHWWYRPDEAAVQACAEPMRLVVTALVGTQIGVCSVLWIFGLVIGLLTGRRRPAPNP